LIGYQVALPAFKQLIERNFFGLSIAHHPDDSSD
jgi:hypothetical protein